MRLEDFHVENETTTQEVIDVAMSSQFISPSAPTTVALTPFPNEIGQYFESSDGSDGGANIARGGSIFCDWVDGRPIGARSSGLTRNCSLTNLKDQVELDHWVNAINMSTLDID